MSGTPPRRGTKGQEIVVVGWSVRWMHIERGAVNCDAGGGGGGGEGGGCRKWISRDRSRKGERRAATTPQGSTWIVARGFGV